MEIQRSNLLNQTAPIVGDDLPDWLLHEILIRLPLNSVFKCRVVSKRWLSLASDPSFIRAYAARGSSQWTIRSSSYYLPDETYSFVNILLRDTNLRPRLHTIQPHGWDESHCRRIGMSDGLVLYSSDTGRYERDFQPMNFYVCNPITGHRIKHLKPASLPRDNPSWGFLTRVDGEFALKSYRIVQATPHAEDLNAVVFNVYYSELDYWKEFTVCCDGPSLDELDLQCSAAVVNGILYWADADIGVIAYNPDLNPEQMWRIPCPHDVLRPHDYVHSCLCLEYRGELRYFVEYRMWGDLLPRFSVWKLQDLSCGEWCLLHKVERMEVGTGIDLGKYPEMNVVCFDPFDSDRVYLIDEEAARTYSYNLKSGLLLDDVSDFWYNLKALHKQYDKFSYSCRDNLRFWWTRLLVVPPWPTHVAEKHLERL